jgi:hypothetical protein
MAPPILLLPYVSETFATFATRFPNLGFSVSDIQVKPANFRCDRVKTVLARHLRDSFGILCGMTSNSPFASFG